MILDALLKFSENQALSGAGGVSTNVIDLGLTVPIRDIGVGEAMAVVISVDVLAFSGGTYVFSLVQSTLDTLASPDVIATRTVLAANLTAGTVFTLEVPQNAITKQYLGMSYTLGGTTPTITVTAFLQPHDMASVVPRAYADAITIS